MFFIRFSQTSMKRLSFPTFISWRKPETISRRTELWQYFVMRFSSENSFDYKTTERFMQFCKECGGALNLFENNDEEVCWCCVQKREKVQPASPLQPSSPLPSTDLDDFAGATFSCENDVLMLTAKEGWVLWSGPLGQPVPFETIIKRARQIYRIRTKRRQHSDERS